MRRSVIALGLMVLVLAPAVAVAKPAVSLKLSGALVEKAADGRVMRTPLEKVKLKPGDDVEYQITAMNGGDGAALHLVPIGEIPAGTRYVDGSAIAAHAHAEFSLDGKTWSAQPTVTVKNAAGVPVVKKADPALYTKVRFVADDPLAAHQSLTCRYDVRVK